jgi:hypothetical protein
MQPVSAVWIGHIRGWCDKKYDAPFYSLSSLIIVGNGRGGLNDQNDLENMYLRGSRMWLSHQKFQ